jgi:hypothetical protein
MNKNADDALRRSSVIRFQQHLLTAARFFYPTIEQLNIKMTNV